MNLSVSKQVGIVGVALSIFAVSMIAFKPSYEEESTLSRREVPSLNSDLSMYKGADEQANDPLTTPTIDPDVVQEGNELDGWDRRLRILGHRAKPSAQTLCEEIAVETQNYSMQAASDGSQPFMEKLSDVRAIADYRKVFPLPNPGERVIILQCRALVLYSIKVEATTDIFMLADSDGNTRVRWEPDNSTARKVNN